MEESIMSKQPHEIRLSGRRVLNFLMIFSILAMGVLMGTLVSYRVDATSPGDSQLQIQTDGKPVAGGAILALSRAFEEVSNRVAPSVVNINTEELLKTPEPDPDDPMNEFFRRFFDESPFQLPDRGRRLSLGSGVIVDPKGYIITNNHVVADATKIEVSLPGGEEYTAEMIGGDPISDIAVIKISGEKDFPYAKIGNSKAMRVGDWVIAIGSPFGLEQTVTAGIISTTGRMFGDDETGSAGYLRFNDYLQTDAAINQGNSGGPLANMNAEVVGINSFISTSNGTSAGVGFAVPSHLFAKIYNQILETGKVSRGWVGVSMNRFNFTPAMAKFFNVKQGSGVLITQLIDEYGEPSDTGPAAKAGVKPEDVVIEFDGEKILNNQDFRIAVADTLPGYKTTIKVVRQGKENELEITVAERQYENQDRGEYAFEETEKEPKAEIGLTFDDVPSQTAKSLGISGGAYVTSVTVGSLAEDAGLIGSQQGRGDVIIAANGKTVNNKDDLFNIVKALKSGEPVIFKFIRSGWLRNNRVDTETCYTSIIKP
jgi:serine protease Do